MHSLLTGPIIRGPEAWCKPPGPSLTQAARPIKERRYHNEKTHDGMIEIFLVVRYLQLLRSPPSNAHRISGRRNYH